jgi:DNA-binding transcriptional LysR family regulator
MEVQQIRYFSRVYETRNFTQAAAQLYITRQALRKSVHKLEQEVGQPLFTNEGNKLVPTEAARRLYDASREAIRGFNELEHEVSRMRLEESGVIGFGQSRGSNDVFTKEEMKAITVSSSETLEHNEFLRNVRTVEGSCAELRRQVLSGEIAYADIIATSIDESLFDYVTARQGHIYLAMHENDDLSQKDIIDIADLKGKRFITQGPGFDVHDLISSRAHDRGFALTIGDVRGNLHDCLPAVEARLGVTYTYRESRFPKIAPHVVVRPFSDDSLRWMYCVISKKGMGDPEVVRFFSGRTMGLTAE